jgi:hypothetical protein
MSQPESTIQYADAPPAGYTLASNSQQVGPSDMVFYAGSASRDAKWERPARGRNVIGAKVQDLWPEIMALAVTR